MATRWTDWIRKFASDNNMTYGCALSDPECSKTYRVKYGKPKKPTLGNNRMKDTSSVKTTPTGLSETVAETQALLANMVIDAKKEIAKLPVATRAIEDKNKALNALKNMPIPQAKLAIAEFIEMNPEVIAAPKFTPIRPSIKTTPIELPETVVPPRAVAEAVAEVVPPVAPLVKKTKSKKSKASVEASAVASTVSTTEPESLQKDSGLAKLIYTDKEIDIIKNAKVKKINDDGVPVLQRALKLGRDGYVPTHLSFAEAYPFFPQSNIDDFTSTYAGKLAYGFILKDNAFYISVYPGMFEGERQFLLSKEYARQRIEGIKKQIKYYGNQLKKEKADPNYSSPQRKRTPTYTRFPSWAGSNLPPPSETELEEMKKSRKTKK